MTHTLYRNFFGNWFGKAKSILVSESGLKFFDVDQNTKEISVEQFIDFPIIKRSIFGSSLIVKFKTNNKLSTKIEVSRIWGISVQSANSFEHNSKLGLNRKISANITRHAELFHNEAISQFLRSSSVNPLHESVTPFIESYRSSKVRWKHILSKQQLSKIDVISRMPAIKEVDSYRQYYERKILSEQSEYFNNIESNPLTEEQRLAVIRNNDKNLILAAAGTGKTSVMVAKALHLITHDKVSADKVLVLAYNNAAAKELKERLEGRKKAYGLSCESPRIMTFHALGLKILKETKENTILSVFSNDPEKLESWITQWLVVHITKSKLAMKRFIEIAYQANELLAPDARKVYMKKVSDIQSLILLGKDVQGGNNDDVLAALQSSGVLAENIKRYIKYLQAIRVEQLTYEQVESRLNHAKVGNVKQYTDFLHTIVQAYIAELRRQETIDFDDMITNAWVQVNQSNFIPSWSDILVDEFQDISNTRMTLLNEIIAKGPRPRLTVVGDDWQSIYRFSGGNLALITQFKKYSGSHSLTTLQKTFRYNNSIAETAGQFVMQNPEQYTKNITTHHQVEQSQIYLVDSDNKSIDKAIAQAVNLIKSNDPSGKIAILARYRYLLNNAKTEVNHLSENNNIHYWTFHGSKGLEADYCIIVGLFQGKTGFPNDKEEDRVLEALLPISDGFKNSEDRRLFYVALTRAKKKVYLIADSKTPSSFIEELLSPSYDLQIMSNKFDNLQSKLYS